MPAFATGGSGGGGGDDGGHGTDSHPSTRAHSGRAVGRAAEAPSEPGAGRGGGVRPGTCPEAQNGGGDAAGGRGAQRPQNLQAAQPLQRPQDIPQQETDAGQAVRATHPGGAAARAAAPAGLRAASRGLHQQQRAAAATAAVPSAELLPTRARPGRRRRLVVVSVLHARHVPGPPEDPSAAARGPRRVVVLIFRRRRQVRLGPGGSRRGQQQRGRQRRQPGAQRRYQLSGATFRPATGWGRGRTRERESGDRGQPPARLAQRGGWGVGGESGRLPEPAEGASGRPSAPPRPLRAGSNFWRFTAAASGASDGARAS